MDDLRQELVALRAEMARQQARIAELEGRAVARSDLSPGEGMTSRRQLLVAAAAAVAGGAAAVSASPARAADGDPLLLGIPNNRATKDTQLNYIGSLIGTYPAFGVVDLDNSVRTPPEAAVIYGQTRGKFLNAVFGHDTSTHTNTRGVEGLTNTGVGVLGVAQEYGGWAVAGLGRSLGVFGRATGFGIGVHGLATGLLPRSIGVLAEATGTGGTALVVKGVHRTTRAGVVTIPAGSRTRFVNLPAIYSTALVFATLQKVSGRLAVAACVIRTTAASAPSGFRITLTGNAAAGGAKVGWVVIDTIGTALPAAAAEEPSEAGVPLSKLSPRERETLTGG